MVSTNSKIILAVLFAFVAIGQSKICPTFCTMEYNPICATNDREYRLFANPCTFEAFECKTKSVWTRLRSLAPCSAEHTTDLSAGCEHPCTREYSPICGTNGDHFEVFNNLCLMNNAHCKDGKTWRQTRMIECDTVTSKLSVKPNGCEVPCTREYVPVCGTNGDHFEVFSNLCLMNNAHCEDGKIWRQTRMSECDTISANLLADLQTNCETPCTYELNPVCGFNGKHHKLFDNLCIMKNEHCKDGLSWYQSRMMDCLVRSLQPDCIEPMPFEQGMNCEKPCQAIYAPVCGFNGESYQMFDNKCLMEVAACDQHVTFVDAPLTACETKIVAHDKNCEKPCPFIYAPVCGFNGRSYEMFPNSCVMEVAECNQHVTFVNAPISACETQTVTQEENCEKPCPFIYAPVCGFNGRSYQLFDNSCVMEVAACNQHVTFVNAPISACETKTVAQEVNCEKVCQTIYDPVCGFDGKSYQMFDNKCLMEVAACDQHVTFVNAPISACETKTVAQEENCEKPCPFIYAPVCGFNGRSYQLFDNSCVMEVAACNQHVTFVNAPISACETKTVAQEVNCEKVCQTIYDPVCGFDGKSYQMFDNKCLMEVAACDQHVTFVNAPISACETKTVAQEENCEKPCPFIYAPVCGFNGRSYQLFDNSCVMEVAACNQHVTFVEAPVTACV